MQEYYNYKGAKGVDGTEQGRSDRQIEQSNNLGCLAMVGLFILIIISVIYSHV